MTNLVKFKICIISYERLNISRNELKGRPFSIIVCDEAHRLRHEGIALFRAVSAINAENWIALTGRFYF
jgi:SNF2 family DNA or RNA helicase